MYCLNSKMAFALMFWYFVPSTVLWNLLELIFILLLFLVPIIRLYFNFSETATCCEGPDCLQCLLHPVGKPSGVNFRLNLTKRILVTTPLFVFCCYFSQILLWLMFVLFPTLHSLAEWKREKNATVIWCTSSKWCHVLKRIQTEVLNVDKNIVFVIGRQWNVSSYSHKIAVSKIKPLMIQSHFTSDLKKWIHLATIQFLFFKLPCPRVFFFIL